jgi:4-aminobutyrate aminotransferase-like enzyme
MAQGVFLAAFCYRRAQRKPKTHKEAMRHDSLFAIECQNLLSYLPFVLEEADRKTGLRYRPDQEKLFWKGQVLDLTKLPLPAHDALDIQSDALYWSAESITDGTTLRAACLAVETLRELLLSENLQARFWSRPTHLTASGFEEGRLPRSNDFLKKLYTDKRVVPEKKAFLVDLWRSTGPYLVADEASAHSFLDAASQIASLAIGHNHQSRSPLLLRPELQDHTLDFKSWDIAKALRRIISEHSQLPHVYFVNSGAEAMETALRSCQMRYPERRQVLAFEGSFHGRTLVALHATHSPAKRLPFEIHSDLVRFLPFPENKNPRLSLTEPEAWLATWADSQDPDLETRVSFWKNSSDILLKSEIESLLALRKSILEEKPLCVVIEPMQCEGGDRYASPRFFRALRLLTRAFDVALVLDEVQCGFGLGGPFFWHKGFELVDADGAPDTPDAIFQAKKSQIGICATRFEMDLIEETAPASIHRGYVQAIETLDHSPNDLAARVTQFLEAFQKTLGPHLIRHPRNQGYAFAFDLPDSKIMNALVSKRFKNGLLFYPAGDQTLRFRLWIGTHEHELFEIFSNLYSCFEELAQDGLFDFEIPSKSEWLAQFPETLRARIEGPRLEEHSIWPEFIVHKDPDDYAAVAAEKWDRAYHKLASKCPQLILHSAKSSYSLKQPPRSMEELVTRYKTDSGFTRLQLAWNAARFFGTRIECAGPALVRQRAAEIDALETRTYEPARRANAKQFEEIAADPRSIVHIALGSDSRLAGISVATPKGPDGIDPLCLYSVDLTLDERHQGRGLGLRFKCEQFIEAMRQGSSALKSRNKHPEASAMARLNFRLSGATTDVNLNDYGGTGTALYQSLSFPRPYLKPYAIGDIREGSLKNKMTLSNFVSRHYVNDMQVLAEVLPPELRHIYLASGRAEAADKSLRLLRWFRPTALEAISVEGSYFGQTTAASRSLGGPWPLRFFDWPLVESPRELEQLLQIRHADYFLGFFAEAPASGPDFTKQVEKLQAFSQICKAHELPFILNETQSAFWRSGSEFCLGGGLVDCDAILIHPGHQIGVLAVKEALFLDKPLMLISTWDGDEFSLSCLKRRILEEAP